MARDGQPPKDVLGGEGAAWGVVTSAGGRLVVAEYGVVLTIPGGALPQDTRQQLYVSVSPNLHHAPNLTDRQVSALLPQNCKIVLVFVIRYLYTCIYLYEEVYLG